MRWAISCGSSCCRTRQRGCRPASDGSRLRRPAGGQSLRQRWAPHRVGQPGRGCRDPAQSQSGHHNPLRLRDVQVAPSGRELLLQDQGVPPHRHPLRQNRHELRGDDPSRRISPRNPMNVNRPYYDNRNSNAVSRMGLVLSLVHQGRLDIEAFAPLTTDKALVGGTHYSDKAPGVAFLALPAAAVARAVAMALGRDGGLAPFFEDGHVSGAYDRAAWLATLSTSALLGALGVVAVFGAARL